MTTLVEIAEKLGELRGDVRASRDDMAGLKDDLGGVKERLTEVELGIAKIHTQTARRRLRERVAVAVAVAILGGLFAVVTAIPGRVWIAAARAIGQ